MKLLWKLLFLFPLFLTVPVDAGAASELHGWDKFKNHPEELKKLAIVAKQEDGSRGWDALRDKSAIEVKALAAKGDVDAQASLAERKLRGIVVDADINGALALFNKCAEKKFAPAAMRLGDLYSSGDVVDLDQAKAVRYYQQAVTLGYPPAEYQLGMMYFCDKHMGGLDDFDKGVKLCKHAAEGGSIKAAVFLGKFYATGTKTMKPNITEAYNWYTLGAHIGSDDCAETLAKAYYKGVGGFKPDVRQAVIYYTMYKTMPDAKKWYKRLTSGEKISPAELKEAGDWFWTTRTKDRQLTEDGWSMLHRN